MNEMNEDNTNNDNTVNALVRPDGNSGNELMEPDARDRARVPEALEQELSRALEAMLMAATEPVEPAVLAQLLEQPATLVNRLCQRLALGYEENGHGFQLVRVAGGWRYQTHPDTMAYVERFVIDGQRARLSGA